MGLVEFVRFGEHVGVVGRALLGQLVFLRRLSSSLLAGHHNRAAYADAAVRQAVGASGAAAPVVLDVLVEVFAQARVPRAKEPLHRARFRGAGWLGDCRGGLRWAEAEPAIAVTVGGTDVRNIPVFATRALHGAGHAACPTLAVQALAATRELARVARLHVEVRARVEFLRAVRVNFLQSWNPLIGAIALFMMSTVEEKTRTNNAGQNFFPISDGKNQATRASCSLSLSLVFALVHTLCICKSGSHATA